MEDEYNKKFKNKELSNENFDTLGLWDNIAEELDAPEKKAPIFSWNTFGISLFALLLTLSTCWLTFDYFVGETMTTKGNTTKKETSNHTDKSQNHTNSLFDRDEKIAKKEENKNTDSFKKTLATKSNFGEDSALKTSEKDSNSSDLDIEISEKSNSIYTNINSNDKVTNLPFKTLATDSTTLKIDKARQIKIFDNSIIQQKKSTINSLDFLKNDWQFLEEKTPTLSDSLFIFALKNAEENWNKKVSKKEKKLVFSAQIYGGVNRTFITYQSESDASYADRRNATEIPIMGSVYGLNTEFSYKNWRINTGVELQNIRTKFSAKTQEDTTVFQPQVLTLVRIDGATGNTLNTEKRDTFVNATNTRTIVHHNNFHRLSIPLEIGHFRTTKKWSYGVSGGTSFDFLINQSGKILDVNNSLFVFDNHTEDVLFQNFGMSLRANLYLAYQINDHLVCTFSPKWTRSIHNILEDSMQTKVQQINLTLGLRSVF